MTFELLPLYVIAFVKIIFFNILSSLASLFLKGPYPKKVTRGPLGYFGQLW